MCWKEQSFKASLRHIKASTSSQHQAYEEADPGRPLVSNNLRLLLIGQHDEPPKKISKLAIAAETDEDRYNTETSVKCYECGDVDKTAGKLPGVIDGVLKANTFARQAEVQAWEQEFTPCEHTLCLQQEPPRKLEQGV